MAFGSLRRLRERWSFVDAGVIVPASHEIGTLGIANTGELTRTLGIAIAGQLTRTFGMANTGELTESCYDQRMMTYQYRCAAGHERESHAAWTSNGIASPPTALPCNGRDERGEPCTNKAKLVD